MRWGRKDRPETAQRALHSASVMVAVTLLGFGSEWLQSVSQSALKHSSLRHFTIGATAGGLSSLLGWLIGRMS